MWKRFGGVLLATALVVCWSSGFVGSVLGARAAPVDSVLMWRSIAAAVAVGSWGIAGRQRVTARGLVRQGVVGLLVQVSYLGCVFAAAGAGVPAGTTALVDALQPLFIAVVAGVLFGERTGSGQIFGLLLGATGAVVVVAGNLVGGHASPWAYLLPVGALVGLGAGTMLDRRWQSQESVSAALAIHCGTAGVVFSAFAISRGDANPPMTSGFLAAVAWLVLFSTAGGYGLYLVVVRRSGATRASTLLYLVPPVTAIWAWLMFGQPLGPATFVGMGVTAVGVIFALRWSPSSSASPAASTTIVEPAPVSRASASSAASCP